MKRALKYFGRFLAALILLVLLAVAFLHTPWGKSFVRGRIEAKLAVPFEGRATIGGLDYGFLFSSVELQNVVILDRAGRTAVSVASINAAIDRSSVLSGAPVIESLAVDGLALTVIEDEHGVANLVGIATPSTTPSKPLASIAVQNISVHGTASITKADGTHVDLTDLAVTGSLTARPADQQADVKLAALSAKVHLARPNGTARDIDLSVANIELGKHGTEIDANVGGVVVGAASIEAIAGHLNIVGGVPTGNQSVLIRKLKIDRAKLQSMLGRELLVADVGVDATLAGPANALAVHGAVTSRATTLALDGTIDLSNRLRPRYDLTLVGTGKSSDVLPPTLHENKPQVSTSIKIGLVGAGVSLQDLDTAITLDIGATTIGNISVDGLSAKASIAHGGYTLETLNAKGLGFEVAGAGTMNADALLHGTLNVAGTPADALRVLHEAGIEVPQRVGKLPPLGHISLAVTADGKVAGDLTVSLAPTRIAIAGGTIDAQGTATLTNKVVTSSSTKIAIHGLDLGAAGRLAGKPSLRGRASGTVSIEKTATGRTADFDLAVALPDPAVVVHAKGRADDTHAAITAHITSGGASIASVKADVPLDAVGLVPTRSWHLTIDAPERSTAELIALAPAKIRAKLPPDLASKLTGTVALHGELTGSPSAPQGTITATVTGPRSGQIRAVITPAHDRLSIQTTGELGVVDPLDGRALAAALSGSISLPRLRFVNRRLAIAKPLDLRIDETIAIADRPLGEFPRVSPTLAELGGTAGGTVHLTGTPTALAIDANLAWRGYRVASGGTAETTLAITGSPTEIKATIAHANAVTLKAAITRTPDRTDVVVTARADAPLLSVLPALPAFAPMTSAGLDVGSLHWDMSANIGLHGKEIDRADVTGTLAVRDASFALPHTGRRWHGIDLELTGDPDGARIRLEAHEKDRERSDRTLEATGLLAISKPTFHPTSLALTLATKNWLVLGLTPVGLADAPTSALDLKATIAADLAAAVKTIDVTIDELALNSPDRHDRAHQPERASVAGDVIFVDSDHRAGVLPVMAPKTPLMASATAPSLDVHVHIVNPAHVMKTPLDLNARGDVSLSIRPNQPIAPVGTLQIVSGSILLFGLEHPLVDGTIQLSAEHPTGLLDLRFERSLPDAAMRDRATKEGARIALSGAPTAPVVKFSGAENATLPEVFALYDTGRSLYAPRPTTFASTSAQTPRGDQTNILAFVSLAIPHMLFLDRASAWSDDSEPRGAYGRIRNLELDRYARRDSTRFRIIGRPTAPGRSTGELQLEHLFVHDNRKAFGIGVRAGDRLGGGIGLTFDWSSD
ncbi:MAG TPA: translocation/assembly module TamB domain-containing protein [Kofleriaceae bacterium]|jgi:hypothetical protein